MKHLFIIAATVLLLLFTACRKDVSGSNSLLPRETRDADTIVPVQPGTPPNIGPPGGPPAEPVDSVIFEKLTWIFPWYSSLEIRNFTDWLFGRTDFKIFIRREHSPEWIEVPLSDGYSINAKYEYVIITRADNNSFYHYKSLYIFYYGFDVGDSPSVKVLFL
jgi:hypothetical protein